MKYPNKEIDRVVREAVKRGWKECGKTTHCKLLAPDGKHSVHFSCTPSDPHAYKNLAKDIVRVEKGYYK